MSSIPEYKRDETKDHLFVLKSLNEIPFPVGKVLLIDFLKGEMENPSITKNQLYEKHNFGALEFLNKNKIEAHIEKLIVNGMIDVSGSVFNKYAKVLSISLKGKEELLRPKLNSKKVSSDYEEDFEISEAEIRAFKELANFLESFNQEQKKAIISKNEKILCIAGAGTGKTTVLTKRIEFLNKYNRVRGDSILAITFTRKAKEEMQKRLDSLGVRAVVETFNSFCEKILLKNGGRIYGRRVRIASYQDKMIAVLKALENQGLDIQQAIDKYFSYAQKRNKTIYQLQNIFINDCFSVFDYFKTTRKSFEKIKIDDDSKMVFEIVKYLEKYMSSNGLRTYSDQINDSLTFFKMYPKYIPQFEHVLVDEFQDVNSNQVELLDLLNPKNLFCVGDPRQSIFGWRGSDIKHILEFKKKFPSSEIIHLKKNYRSEKTIIELMNESISEMKMPHLEYTFSEEKEIILENFSNENEEFVNIVERILKSGIPREEIFVLARTNRQLSELSELMKKVKIPHILKDDERKIIEAKKGEVTLSTIHSIKGLEAEMVFLIGCTTNNFPSKTTDHPVIDSLKMYEYDKEEEERRLFYVAISRAKNKLYLSYTGKNPTYFINEKMKKIIG